MKNIGMSILGVLAGFITIIIIDMADER